jgi:hypothetical protein
MERQSADDFLAQARRWAERRESADSPQSRGRPGDGAARQRYASSASASSTAEGPLGAGLGTDTSVDNGGGSRGLHSPQLNDSSAPTLPRLPQSRPGQTSEAAPRSPSSEGSLETPALRSPSGGLGQRATPSTPSGFSIMMSPPNSTPHRAAAAAAAAMGASGGHVAVPALALPYLRRASDTAGGGAEGEGEGGNNHSAHRAVAQSPRSGTADLVARITELESVVASLTAQLAAAASRATVAEARAARLNSALDKYGAQGASLEVSD